MKIDYSILLLNMNALENLKLQLPVLANLKGINYELIIIDNNSTDKGKEYIKLNYPNLKLISLEKNIGTAAFNIGLQEAKGKYIVYIGDMIFGSKTLKELRKALDNDPEVGIAVPYLINYFSKIPDPPNNYVSRTLYQGKSLPIIKKGEYAEVLKTGVGMMARHTAHLLGDRIYDQDYFLYGEDLDLGLKIRLLGKISVIVPTAIMYHAHIPVTNKSFSKFFIKFITERNLTLTFLRTFYIRNIILYLPYLLFTRCLGSLKDLSHLEFQYFLGRNYALLWLLFHPFYILKKRKESQSIRRVDDKYLSKLFSEKAIFSFKNS